MYISSITPPLCEILPKFLLPSPGLLPRATPSFSAGSLTSYILRESFRLEFHQAISLYLPTPYRPQKLTRICSHPCSLCLCSQKRSLTFFPLKKCLFTNVLKPTLIHCLKDLTIKIVFKDLPKLYKLKFLK